MKYTSMKATVKGTTCNNEPFTENLVFTMIPPNDSNHYGTGYYMMVEANSDNFPKRKDYVDVRYARTTDVEILADQYIENYYGRNAQEVVKQFEPELVPMPGSTDPDWGEKHWGREG